MVTFGLRQFEFAHLLPVVLLGSADRLSCVPVAMEHADAMMVEDFAQVEAQNKDVERIAELKDWAAKEKLSMRFREDIPNIVEQGGLAIINEEYLQKLGVLFQPARTKIMQACEAKLMGFKKLRFGATEYFEPVLANRPSGKPVWMNIGLMETRDDKAVCLAALRTWRLFATGSDGEEEKELLQDAFGAWKEASKEPENFIMQIFSDVLEGIGAFFSSVPCCGSRS
eukprot:Skav236332  [mRNA]  locus=scaffold97:285398:286760:- [translate_table: standard]